MRRLSIRLPFFLLLASLTAGGFTLNGCASGFNLVSVDEEWEMGQQLERDVAQQVDVLNDATLTSYVNQIGQRIVSQTELRNRPWRFYVVRDDAINAFNVPGGLVYVNTGLIAAADNTAELAGVIAHEVAHGAARHGTQRMTQAYGLNVAAALLLGQDPGLGSQIAAQIAGGGAIAKFSRDDEREADVRGVRYMARAGYNPEGMATMFAKLMADRQRRPSSVEQFFSTHPLTEERVADVRREARKYPSRGLTTNDGRYASIRARAGRY
jgi:beta-barrel assembly-enhancing protease